MVTANDKKNVLLGVTGSIAAYKAAELARRLVNRGMNVRVVMTKSATEFISPLTFEVLTGNAVVVDFWDGKDFEGIDHIELGGGCDIIAIVPATAETIAKMANGQADSELLAAVLVSRAPVLLAPAMNVNMYGHVATQENLAKLVERGVEIIEPEEGALACGWNGSGRLADIDEIYYHIIRVLTKQDYKGQKVVITAGPTREMIDPVRFISNCSSGKMGIAIAKEAYLRGADVKLIHGPIEVADLPSDIGCLRVTSAQQMYEQVIANVFDTEEQPDIVVMTAAVADYRPKNVTDYKLKKTKDKLDSIDLAPNPDILMDLGSRRGAAQTPKLIGFAVETGEPEDLIAEVRKKLDSKQADIIVGNLAHEAFDKNTNHVWIIDQAGRQDEIQTTFKSMVARKIFDAIGKLH